jgi:nitrate reductase gamma subunit
MATYYIPGNDAKFDAWFNHLVEYVLAKVLAAAPVWTHIPKADFRWRLASRVNSLNRARFSFSAAFDNGFYIAVVPHGLLSW